ncbi:MAG: histone deacetylase [Alkalispirochaeta sp.]
MILHDRLPRRPMTDYGIQIPIMGSNAMRTIEHLLEDPYLAETRDSWLFEEEISPVSAEAIRRVHDDEYVNRLLSSPRGPDGPCEGEMQRTFELVNDDGTYHRYDPDSAKYGLCELRNQSLRLAGGTSRGAELALSSPEKFCFYLGGGMHHGQYRWGEGFCPVNDLVIAIRSLQAAERIKTAWVIDVDAHKGDGTAALTAEDDTIQTVSVHMAQGWPMDQPQTLADGASNPSFVPSTIDVPIASGEENEYLPRLTAAMDEMERLFRLPDFVLVVDGADPYERDQLPSAELLKMTGDQLFERDAYLYRWVRERDIPSLFVMAGNYGYHSWEVYTRFLAAQIRGDLEV